MLKQDRRTAGIALIASACSVLLTQCCKKKGPSTAVMAMCAAQGAIGLYLLDENKVIEGKVKEQVKKVAAAVQMPVGCEEDEEIFENEEDVVAAEDAINDELNGDEQI